MKISLLPGLTQICDSYSLDTKEYFFDRSPRNFDAVLGLYRTGKMHLANGVSRLFCTTNTDILQMSRCACKTSARSLTTGGWMNCTWSRAASTPTTGLSGSCLRQIQRYTESYNQMTIISKSQKTRNLFCLQRIFF